MTTSTGCCSRTAPTAPRCSSASTAPPPHRLGTELSTGRCAAVGCAHMRIEDYGLIGDLGTAALVGCNGSIDWLCLPRFDSGACFAALLGDETHGRWLIAPAGEVTRTECRYRPGTLVLETDVETADGAVRVIDFMPRREGPPQLMRIVEGLRGPCPDADGPAPAL